MGLLDNLRIQGAAYRINEEAIYAEVLREMEAGIRRDGLWAKALSEANGIDSSANARYISLRVQALKDEIALIQAEKTAAMKKALEAQKTRRQTTGKDEINKQLTPKEIALAEERRLKEVRRCKSSLAKDYFSWACVSLIFSLPCLYVVGSAIQTAILEPELIGWSLTRNFSLASLPIALSIFLFQRFLIEGKKEKLKKR